MKSVWCIVAGWLVLAMPVAAEIVERAVPYGDGDARFAGTLVYDDAVTAPRPGVLIVHQWTGPGRYEIYRARMLAQAGYVAFVADIYGLDADGKPIRPESGPAAAAIASRFRDGDRSLFRKRVRLALETLRAMPEAKPDRLAAVGYCFGGTAVLELARDGADLKAVVSVHGGLDSPDPAAGAAIRASVLILHASEDPTTPPDKIDALKRELDTHGVDWQMNTYTHRGHSFTDPEGAGYNPIPGGGGA